MRNLCYVWNSMLVYSYFCAVYSIMRAVCKGINTLIILYFIFQTVQYTSVHTVWNTVCNAKKYTVYDAYCTIFSE